MKRLPARAPAIGALLLSLLFVLPVGAQTVAVGIRLGSMGPGLELTGALTPHLNGRVGGNLFSYERGDRITDRGIISQADSDLQFGSVRALLDLFPFRRGIRLTAGVILNRNRVETVVSPLGAHDLGEKQLSPVSLGEVAVTVDYGSLLHPYAGLGFGNSVRPNKRVGFVFDVGLMVTGAPSVEMVGSGMLAPTADQAAEFEEHLSGFTLYPLLSVGISYKFLGTP